MLDDRRSELRRTATPRCPHECRLVHHLRLGSGDLAVERGTTDLGCLERSQFVVEPFAFCDHLGQRVAVLPAQVTEHGSALLHRCQPLRVILDVIDPTPKRA